jgi:uncharacterized protein YgbK (DUF1537 family)
MNKGKVITAPLLAYYADDLTGSAGVMEPLGRNGIETVLFIHQPKDEHRARFPNARVIGLAGTSRSETPDWMRRILPSKFAWLASLGADFNHYIVCSTFDSAPHVGCTGTAIDIARKTFGGGTIPLVVGVPQMRRYTVFGQLFAVYQDRIYRIDRHPVMSRHPVTPMAEADLVLHLGAQTTARIGLVDQLSLEDSVVDAAARENDVVMLDVCDHASQVAAGRQLLRMQAAGSRFVVGSAGVEYALAAAWMDAGLISGTSNFPELGRVNRIAVVSGSVSPTTERQIRYAKANGFICIALNPHMFLGVEGLDNAVAAAQTALSDGHSVILHTAMGPSSDISDEFVGIDSARHRIGQGLGRLLAELVREHKLRRVVIAGGDTSSHALHQIGIFALTICLPVPRASGSPLCTAHSDKALFDGMQIALKGGQIGGDDYFTLLRDGVS